MNIYLAFQGGGDAIQNTFKTWNEVTTDNGSSVALLDGDGSPSGSTFTNISGPWSGNIFGADAVGTGDASWVDESVISFWGIGAETSSYSFSLSGAPGDRVNLEFFVSHPEGRITRLEVNGQIKLSLLSAERNTTDVVLFEQVVFDASGEILVVVSKDSTSSAGAAYLNALYMYDAPEVATLTPTNPPQGGEVFQFSGSTYSAQPTGPMTFTQGTRTISRAVTISNWNAEDGSFTGVTDTALPGVPAAGASDTPALLYGEPVTISLPDPGA